MKKLLYTISFLLFLLASCKEQNKDAASSSSDIDAARNFLNASLKQQFDVARQYMLPDPVNEERLNAVSRIELDSHEKQGLWGASINIHERKLINDTSSIIVYSNSYHKESRDTLRVINRNGSWLVDFKYLFNKDL